EQDGGEGHELGDGRGARAPVKPDRAAALGEIEGDQSRRGVPAEEERGVLDEHGASILDLQGLTQRIRCLAGSWTFAFTREDRSHVGFPRGEWRSSKFAHWHRACWTSRDGPALLDPGQRGLPCGR